MVSAFAAALGLSLIIPVAIMALAMRPPAEHSSASARWIYTLDQMKREIGRQTPGDRVVLLGGSSVLYSVRAETLSMRLGRPVINEGLHAALRVNYLLYRARQVLRPGDTVVLFLEYNSYRIPGPQWTLADFVLPHDLGYLSTLGFNTIVELAGKLTTAEYAWRVYDSMAQHDADLSGISSRINAFGDLVTNEDGSQNAGQRAAWKKASPFNLQAGPRAVVDGPVPPELRKFVEWCRARNIRVIGGFQAFRDFPSYHEDAATGFFEQVRREYEVLGVPTLGRPEDYLFPGEWFFDSVNHLHAAAADKMTELVAERLEKLL